MLAIGMVVILRLCSDLQGPAMDVPRPGGEGQSLVEIFGELTCFRWENSRSGTHITSSPI